MFKNLYIPNPHHWEKYLNQPPAPGKIKRTLQFEITDKDNKPVTFLFNEVCLSVEFREGIKGAAEEFPHL